MRSLILMSTMIIFSSCLPEFDFEPKSPASYECESEINFEVVWQVPIASDTSSIGKGLGDPSIITDRGVLSIKKNRINNKYSLGLALRDFASGEIIWEISLPKCKENYLTDKYSLEVINNTIIASGRKRIHAIDLNDGTLLWDTEIARNKDPVNFRILDDFVYFVESNSEEESNCDSIIYSLIKTELRHLQKEILFSNELSIKMEYNGRSKLPLLYQNKGKGNTTIGIFKEGHSENTKLYAYNITKKQLIWESHRIGPKITLKLKDDKLFILEHFNLLSCIDIHTGKTFWTSLLNGQNEQGYSSYKGEMLIITDKLMVKTKEYVYAVDKQTGLVLWDQIFDSNHGFYFSQNDYCNTTFIMDYKQTYAFDLDTGDELWKTEGLLNCATLQADLGVSISQKHFLFQDKQRMILGKIPDSILGNCEEDDE